jgi:LuxR family transcriptional regulator, maltose regulon positive regulatory protein
MFMPILATKLHIPQSPPKIIHRPHLIERLNDGMHCKLALISAPAGFGKTTLVSEWVAGCGRTAAWLSLDEGDDDPSRFLSYLISALQTIAANIGVEVLVTLESPEPPPIESILITLINEITTVPEKFVLVLDDYHVIDSKLVDEALAFLLEHLPSQMHMVITTREDPHLPLAQYRARGQLIELRAADLRFTPAEAGEFLNKMMGLRLSEEDIAALETRTEGWIAGLHLAALSMQGHQDSAGFIKSFTGSHHFVLDYLVEEVLKQQSESIQAFLLRTSILDRLCGPLCDAVLGPPSASGQETLEYLERANLFMVPLDNVRRWYRYHHLFADILRMHLMAEQPDQKSTLHRRASEWYEHNGSAADAIHHALAAKDFERAATLIELAVPEMRRNRQGATVTELGWLKALPDELVRFRPVLCVDYAYALFGGGEPGGVESWLQDAERWLEVETDKAEMVVEDEKEFRRLPSMIALLRAAIALAQGDMSKAEKNARRVLDLAPEDAHLMLGGAASVLGLAAWARGDLETGRRMTSEGITNVRQAGYISSAIGGSIVLADIQIALGRLHEAMSTYERALTWAVEPGAPIQRGAADMYVGISALQQEHNDLETATQHLLKSQSLGELAGLQQNPYRWCVAMARIREAQGDLDGALDLLDQAEHLYDGNFSPNVRPISARKTRLWVAQGRLGEALRWVNDQGLSVENELSYLHEFDHLTLARVLLARYLSDHAIGSISEVMGLLERLLKAAEKRGGKGSVIEILVLQAISYHAQGDLPAALLPLQHALVLAEPEDYVRIFLDEGTSMMQLLREASARKIMPDYVDKLLAAYEFDKLKSEDHLDLSPTLSKGHHNGEPFIEPLSQREFEILKLISLGLSNREIGERLFLALDTVKGHNRRIFEKLQVQSRTEAVARARELGLL